MAALLKKGCVDDEGGGGIGAGMIKLEEDECGLSMGRKRARSPLDVFAAGASYWKKLV